MGAETTFIDRFNPPAIASMAYLPCCDEWADCRETEECPFCGVDLADESCWGPDLRLVKAVFKFDRLETEGKFGQPPLPWTMKEALSELTRRAEQKEPDSRAEQDAEPVVELRPEQLDEYCECGHVRSRHATLPYRPVCSGPGCKCDGFDRAWDGWPCEGWGGDRRAECLFEFEDCNGKPDCPRNLEEVE